MFYSINGVFPEVFLDIISVIYECVTEPYGVSHRMKHHIHGLRTVRVGFVFAVGIEYDFTAEFSGCGRRRYQHQDAFIVHAFFGYAQFVFDAGYMELNTAFRFGIPVVSCFRVGIVVLPSRVIEVNLPILFAERVAVGQALTGLWYTLEITNMALRDENVFFYDITAVDSVNVGNVVSHLTDCVNVSVVF